MMFSRDLRNCLFYLLSISLESAFNISYVLFSYPSIMYEANKDGIAFVFGLKSLETISLECNRDKYQPMGRMTPSRLDDKSRLIIARDSFGDVMK